MGKQIVETIFHQHRVSFYDAVSCVGDHYVYAVGGGLKLTAKTQGRKGYAKNANILNIRLNFLCALAPLRFKKLDTIRYLLGSVASKAMVTTPL